VSDRLRVLHLIGVDDSRTVTVTFLSPDPARLGYGCAGNVELAPLIDAERFELVPLLCGDIPSESAEVARLDVALNAICDPDTNGASLRAAARTIAKLRIGVVNDPARVAASCRDVVSRALADLPGAVVPATVKVAPSYISEVEHLLDAGAITLPFLFREAGSHGGHSLVRIDHRSQLRNLERFAFDGRRFYATEFVEFRSDDGLYRKYRALVVGGAVHRKHLIVCDDWNIHSRSRVFMADRPDLRDEEAAWVEDGIVDLPAFSAMHAQLGLDFFGVDYGVLPDGRMVLFEVNACARALQGGTTSSSIASHQDSTERIKESLAAVLADKARQRQPASGGP
jgi:hypothetical protein